MSNNSNNQLITFQALATDLDLAVKNDTLNELLNRPPRESWLKARPAGKGKGKYMPISRIEQLLTAIFQKWYIEIKDTKILGNSVVSIVTLHYWIPQFKEWRRADGCGAAPLQVDAGADANDAGAMKSAAVQMAAPMSVSYALKDAAHRLGALFGRDVNNKDADAFKGMYSGAASAMVDKIESEEEETTEATEAEPTIDLPL